MTGCYPPRIGINHVLFPGDSQGLSREEFTMPQLFRNAGYKTMIVGKWHCGDQKEFLPTNYGFDDYYGLPYSNDMGMQKGREDFKEYPPLPLISGDEVIEEQPCQESLTERYTERCIDFIRKSKNCPFLLYFAQMHTHLPLYSAAQFEKNSENGDYGACMAETDWSVAAIVSELKKQGIYQDTLIIFTSDNGSRGDHGASNYPLKGRKFTTWEGGMRVPMIMCWEGHIPGGQVCRSIISHIDLLPTLASLIGESPGEKKIDGVDCLEIMPQ